MILKVRQPDTRKWFYYDNITLFKYGWVNIPYPRPPMSEGEISLLSAEPKDMQSSPEDGTTESVLRCDLLRSSMSDLTVFAEDAYLLNDDGKTIERL